MTVTQAKGDAGMDQGGAVKPMGGAQIPDALGMRICQKLLMNWVWRVVKNRSAKDDCGGSKLTY